MQFPFGESRVALVTGGSRGIGRALVEALAAQGLSVAFTWRSSEPEARELEERLGVRGYRADVRSTEEVAALAKAVKEELGPVDLLVNNAGMTRDRLLFQLSDEDWEAVLDANLGGTFRVSRAIAYDMMKRRRGTIVNISSVSGLVGVAGQTAYAAAKAGTLGFTRALARETVSRGVRVNAVALGPIETEMTAAMPEKARQGLLSAIPMGRFGAVQECVGAVLFLLSDLSSYVTGQILVVDGGLTG